jgi:hypothetical protein
VEIVRDHDGGGLERGLGWGILSGDGFEFPIRRRVGGRLDGVECECGLFSQRLLACFPLAVLLKKVGELAQGLY